MYGIVKTEKSGFVILTPLLQEKSPSELLDINKQLNRLFPEIPELDFPFLAAGYPIRIDRNISTYDIIDSKAILKYGESLAKILSTKSTIQKNGTEIFIFASDTGFKNRFKDSQYFPEITQQQLEKVFDDISNLIEKFDFITLDIRQSLFAKEKDNRVILHLYLTYSISYQKIWLF